MIISKKLVKIFLLIIIVLAPWGISSFDDDVETKYIDSSALEYYQINTCDVSFIKIFIKNFSNTNVKYEFDNYSSMRCFGRVNGLDKDGEVFKVGIGTNLLINFLIQSLFWIVLISFISKSEKKEFKNISVSIFILLILFLLHLYGENRFYEISARNFNLNLDTSNFYIFSVILNFLIVSYMAILSFETRFYNLILYLPYIFLVTGTFNYMNYNFLILIFGFFGIQNLIETNYSRKYSYVYLLFSIFWISQQNNNLSFFDVDKLRGFSNSSLSTSSLVFWFVSFYLIIHGIIYLYKHSVQNIDNLKIAKNFIITGSLITILGLLSSLNSFINFFTYFYFGLNKRAMTQISSISGNTWRGLAPSAESIGEFFAFSVFLFVFLIIKKQIKLNFLYIGLLLINVIGLLRANNVAAILSLTVIFILFILNQRFEMNIKSISIFTFIIFLLTLAFFFTERDISISPSVSYEAGSKSLILEGLKYSNLFEGETDRYKNVSRYFNEENDLETIFLYPGNKEKVSTSLKFVSNIYTQNIDIPYFPNPVAGLSIFALSINRSEKWGIFLSKYNPNIYEFLFGSGPLQISSYYNGHNKGNVEGLLLPHSSFLDLILFFGFIGFIGFTFFILRILVKNLDIQNPYWFLLVFLIINFIKSDSIMYISPLILFIFTILQNLKGTKKD